MTQTTVDSPQSEWTCTHEHQEVRDRLFANGVWHVVLQCMDCGTQIRALPKGDSRVLMRTGRVLFDDDLRDRKLAERMIEWQQIYSEQQAQERAEEYSRYLLSDAWRARRSKVLERDRYLCQACLDAPATEVHHLHYRHIYHEPLFELVSVCRPCHEEITALDHPS